MGRKRSADREKNSWVETICRLPLMYRTGEKSILQHFEPARAHLGDRTVFLAAISTWLRKHPDLVEAWQWYSEDKRTTGPYLDLNKLEVGLYEAPAGYHGICRHTDPVDACADFLYREAMRVLESR